MNNGLINKIIPFSFVDGPGNRTVIFLQGCNFNCDYCHNPETINKCKHCGQCIKACPAQALSTERQCVIWDRSKCIACDNCLRTCKNYSSPKAVRLGVNEIVREVSNYLPFISGITVSGGECTLQAQFLTQLFTQIKRLNLTTMIDTNASVPLFDLPELMQVTDGVMVDLKSYAPQEHIELTGQNNTTVLLNLKFLASIHKLHEVRTVIVPGLLNNVYNVQMTSTLLASLDRDIIYKLIRFRPTGVRKCLAGTQIPSEDLMSELGDIARENGLQNIVIV